MLLTLAIIALFAADPYICKLCCHLVEYIVDLVFVSQKQICDFLVANIKSTYRYPFIHLTLKKLNKLNNVPNSSIRYLCISALFKNSRRRQP